MIVYQSIIIIYLIFYFIFLLQIIMSIFILSPKRIFIYYSYNINSHIGMRIKNKREINIIKKKKRKI